MTTHDTCLVNPLFRMIRQNMPYAQNSELPASVRDHLPDEAQSVFRRVVNEQIANGKNEGDAFPIAWAAVENGWHKNDGGKWVRKEGAPESMMEVAQRSLKPLEGNYASVPFKYDGNVLGHLREDQVPRFFGALTDTESLPVQHFAFPNLTAMQNRVSVPKVEAIRHSTDQTGKKPLVVINGDKTYLADGHHRATAAWLDGKDGIEAHYKDITPETNAVKLFKVDDSLGLVFGWAIVSKVNGADYFDTQGDHIPEEEMLKASVRFIEKGGIAKEMHVGDVKGKVVFAWPMTGEIAKAMGIGANQTGLMIAMKPDNRDMLEKFKSGKYTGFSIGGRGVRVPVE